MMDRLNAALGERYTLLRELGEGGMAIVFLAEDVRHHRKVALKVLKPELAAVLGGERFLSEIETTAQLQHPNILPLFDSGEADGFLFYVMPFVEGETLRERLDRERQLPVEEAVRLATEVADALQSAHEHGVVHRDIKPANVLISHGRPLVADFGIALAVASAGSHRLTETGLSVGTPHYMSPEQATGDRLVGPQSDIYSLGCVLYEMLVGEPPYTGSTAQAVLGRVITGDPRPVTEERRAVPPHVDAVVRKALEKIPADRFASAGELARSLADPSFRYGAPLSSVGPGSRALTWAGWALAALLGAGLIVMGRGADAEPEVRRFSIAFPAETGPSEWLGLSPDGSALVMADQPRSLGFSLFLQRFDDHVRTPISDSRDGFDPVFSPDGSVVVFGGAERVRLAPVNGGSTRTLVDDVTACCLRWGADDWIYFQAGGGIQRVRPAGGSPEPVAGSDEADLYYYTPLDDGRFGLVQADLPEGSMISVYDRETGELRPLVEGVRPYLTEDGYLVFGQGESIYAARFDRGPMDVEGTPVRMVELVGTTDSDAYFTLADGGDLAYWVDQTRAVDVRELVWIDRDGSVQPVDDAWQENFESVELSPDGTRAAVTIGDLFDTEIWVKDLDAGPARRLTTYQGMNRRPVWSPDGTELAFITDRNDGNREAYVVPVDGVVAPRLLLAHPGLQVDEVGWSADGDWLIYRTGTSVGDRDIFARRIRPDTMTIAVSAQPEVDERAPALSPDGRWIAYVSDETGEEAIWVRPFPNVGAGSRRVSPARGLEPVWSGDGRELFFRTQTVNAVSVTDPEIFTTGAVQALFPTEDIMFFTSHRAYAYDSANERILAIRMVREGVAQPELMIVQNFMDEVRDRLAN